MGFLGVDREKLPSDEKNFPVSGTSKLRLYVLLGILVIVLAYFVNTNVRYYFSDERRLSDPELMKTSSVEFQRRETPHLIIYNRNKELADYVEKKSEEVLPEIISDLKAGSVSDFDTNKIVIRITKENNEYNCYLPYVFHQIRKTEFNQSTGELVINQSFATPQLNLFLPHELTHAVILRYLGKAGYEKIPEWPIEGLEMYEEAKYGRSRTDRYLIIVKKDLISKKDTPFEFRLPVYALFEDDKLRDTSYVYYFGICYCVTDYLVENFGMERYIRFIASLCENDFPTALIQIYGKEFSSPGDFDNQLITYTINKKLESQSIIDASIRDYFSGN